MGDSVDEVRAVRHLVLASSKPPAVADGKQRSRHTGQPPATSGHTRPSLL